MGRAGGQGHDRRTQAKTRRRESAPRSARSDATGITSNQGRVARHVAVALMSIVLVSLLLGGVSAWLIREAMRPERDVILHGATSVADAERLRSLSERRARETRALLFTRSKETKFRYDEADERLQELLVELRSRAADNEDGRLLAEVERTQRASERAVKQLVASGAQGAALMQRFTDQLEPLREETDNALDNFARSRQAKLDQALSKLGSVYVHAFTALALAVAAAITLSILIGIRLTRSLRALEMSEERFRTTFDHAAVGIARVHLDGQFLEVNDRYCELVGYPREELVTKTFQVLTHPDDVEEDVALTIMLERGEIPLYSMEKRYFRKDGRIVWVDLAVSLVRDEEGKPLYFIAVVADINERRAAEDALRRERDFSAAILDTLDALVIVLDTEGRVVRWNRACEDCTGYSADELYGQPFWERLIDAEEVEGARRVFEKARADPLTVRFENEWVAKDGYHHRIAWATTVLLGEGGEVEHVIGTGIDVTDQRRAEAQRSRLYQEAQDAIRVRDEFLSIASHELKTPLTPLSLQVSSILRSLRKDPSSISPDRLLPKLETIHRQVERLSSLVSDLLDISRITAGRLGLRIEEVDLSAVARDVALRLGYELSRAGYKLNLKASSAIAGQWDRARLDQIVTNLLSNAIKYGNGKPISLIVEGDENNARLIVRDQGIGISREHQARIFDRFERAVSDQHFGGFGLGLWIVKQITDALGGTIAVESAPGEGATFTVELPRRVEMSRVMEGAA